MKSVGF